MASNNKSRSSNVEGLRKYVPEKSDGQNALVRSAIHGIFHGESCRRYGVAGAWHRQQNRGGPAGIAVVMGSPVARHAISESAGPYIQRFMAIGITPVFRLQNDDLTGLYGEAGVGLRHLFELYDNNGHRLSTNFQFASHLGAGYVFRNNVDVGLRIQHFSNGSIKKPNGGVNFIVARVAYRF